MSANKSVKELNGTEINGRVFLDVVKRYVLNYGDFDSAHKAYIPIAHGDQVENVRATVKAVFDDGITAEIGDADDADGYLATGMVVPTVLGSKKNSLNAAVFTTNTLPTFTVGTPDVFTAGTQASLALRPYASGRDYPNGGLLCVTLSGAVTKGQLLVEVVLNGYEEPRRDMINNY